MPLVWSWALMARRSGLKKVHDRADRRKFDIKPHLSGTSSCLLTRYSWRRSSM